MWIHHYIALHSFSTATTVIISPDVLYLPELAVQAYNGCLCVVQELQVYHSMWGGTLMNVS